MGQKYFGTDGIRGRVGTYPITPEFCLRLSWAVGKVFAGQDRRARVLVGKDTRISGYMLESVIQSGLASAGADVSLLGPMPTPAIAYLTRTLGADAGIVISASHNPYYDNGIKFFDRHGSKLSDAVEQEIEATLDTFMVCEDSQSLGRASRITDAPGRYVEFCKSCVSSDFSLRGMRIVVDCANGATYGVAAKVFEELGADVVLIFADPDGFNINENCGSTHPENLRQRVVAENADLGIAFDGDGDRLVMVDHEGSIVDGDEIIFGIAQSRKLNKKLKGGVVGTVMSNFGLEKALEGLSIPFLRANVGDRHVLELMKKKKWVIGGEPSGHILTMDLTTTGDAIVAALQVLVAMKSGAGDQQSLKELVTGMHKVPQILLNVEVASPGLVAQSDPMQAAINEQSKVLEGRGRVLVRASGTEPLLRVMVEGDSEVEVKRIAQELVQQALDIALPDKK
ncbi:MAG: phosphoglucosamine mutase [Candidatus Azotimanducaceae bacterium]|jgi:phosphoglucosamine mutase|tara:strand:+ start:10990 stop:12351 length:1362 start_codon:yes stop_codon:yes gene_type:complete